MEYLILSFTGYLLSSVIGFVNKKTSYIAGFLSSFILFFVAIYANYHNASLALFNISDGITLSIKLDKLNAIFLLISSIVWMAISVFSIDFGNLYKKRMSILLNLSMLGMVLVFVANDFITFLCGYEIMTIASYIMLLEKNNRYKGAFLFLAFSELSTILLMLAFAISFSYYGNINLLAPDTPKEQIYFLFFASFAFIIKMDIVPFHVWIKDAYSNAPSNVLAILSSSVTLIGVYGIFRILSLTHANHLWGIMALTIGSFSAFWGAIQAAASKGVKILPAYSTIENNGLILSLLGLYFLTSSLHTNTTLSTFAYIGAIILAFAHSISKTLLFLSIGEAKELLQEDEINNIRGIHASVGKIPAYGIVVSGLSFSAFPPLIGYVAEWIVLESIFQSYQFSNIFDRIISSSSGVLMALAMGFATFSMIKLIGYSALGYHHEKQATKAKTLFMEIPQIALMLIIFLSGISITYGFIYLDNSKFVTGALAVPKGFLLASAQPVFGVISPFFYAIVTSVFFMFTLLIYISKKRKTKKVLSWNGGINLKENEYFTVESYSFIIKYILRYIYRAKEISKRNQAYVIMYDAFDFLYKPIISSVRSISFYISKTVMNGKTHLYILYIVIAFMLCFVIF